MDDEALATTIRDVAEGRASRADAIALLLGSKVAVLLDKGLEGGQLARDARPLSLDGPDGRPVIAVFSSVGKGAPWVQREPRFGFALLTGFRWVLEIAPVGAGIAVDPGYRFDFRLPAEDVQALKAGLRGANAEGQARAASPL